MTRNRKEVDFAGIKIDRNLPRRLHRVGVEKRPLRVGHLRDRLHREDRPGFVVRPHDRNRRRRFVDRTFRIRKIQTAAFIDRNVFDFISAAREFPAVGEYAGVFDDGRDDFVPPGPGGDGGVDRGIVSFAAAARENDLRGIPVVVAEARAEKRGNLPPRFFNVRGNASPKTVDARRIAVSFAEKGTHRLEHLRIDRGRGVVVQIDDFILIHDGWKPPPSVGRQLSFIK